MSRLIVYAGPNGAGKSSLRDLGVDAVEVVIDTDRIAQSLDPLLAELAQIEAGRRALELFRQSMTDRKSISLETTLTGQTVLNRIGEAKAAGYDIELRFIAIPSAEAHIARVQQRVREGGHDIPPEIIIRRYARSLDNLPQALGLANSGRILDNLSSEKRILLQIDNGQILYQYPHLPTWLLDRMPKIERVLRNQPNLSL